MRAVFPGEGMAAAGSGHEQHMSIPLGVPLQKLGVIEDLLTLRPRQGLAPRLLQSTHQVGDKARWAVQADSAVP